MGISYSDGQRTEARILGLLRDAKNLAADQRIAGHAYGEWAVHYHLCPERSNLIRHLDFAGLDVLELGAGMGALSRYIAETARSLMVIEGTQARFEALSERLRDLKNWTGVVSNIQDVKPDRKFDVVCIFGVLEYAEIYLDPPAGKSPFQAFLETAKGHLKEDGSLILAIENQLGAKYWSGAAEDHSGHLFDGIVGYPRAKSAKTFSRKGLKALLTQQGFSAIDEYFPFPDYKIPASVMSLEMIESAPEIAGDLAINKPYENYGLPRFRAFPDSLAVPTLSGAGLLPELSNSFLFVASSGDHPTRRKLLSRQLQQGELGWHYSLSRKIPTQTLFKKESRGISVTKVPLRQDARPSSGEFRWTPLAGDPIRPGEKLRTRLLRDAYFGDWKAFENQLTEFLQWSLNHWQLTDGMMAGGALDATFINTALGSQGFELYDLEWSSSEQMAATWFVFRNVFLLVHDRDLIHSGAPFANFQELYVLLCTRLNLSPAFAADVEREVAFLSQVTDEASKEVHRSALLALFSDRLGPSPYPRTPAASENAVALSHASAEVQRLNRKLNQIHHRKIEQLATAAKKIPGLKALVKSVLR